MLCIAYYAIEVHYIVEFPAVADEIVDGLTFTLPFLAEVASTFERKQRAADDLYPFQVGTGYQLPISLDHLFGGDCLDGERRVGNLDRREPDIVYSDEHDDEGDVRLRHDVAIEAG